MKLDSPLFWVFFLVSVLILAVRARKKRPLRPTKPKGVSGSVVYLSSPLERQTPLACLEDDGKKFGSLFQDKEPPLLPHGPGCKCVREEGFIDSNRLYSGKGEFAALVETDLGPLGKQQRRYYRCRLVLAHPNCSEEQRSVTEILLEHLKVEPTLTEKINQHLGEKP